MRRILLALCCLVLAGCYARRMGSWVGHPRDELLAVWGLPTSRVERPDGSVLTWEELELGYEPCRKSFITDRGGRIVRWSITGCDPLRTRIPGPRRRAG